MGSYPSPTDFFSHVPSLGEWHQHPHGGLSRHLESTYTPHPTLLTFQGSVRPAYLSKPSSAPYPLSSVAQSCPTLCDPMNRSTPGFPDHHQLLELTQTQIHPVGDAIQPSHSLSPLLLPLSILPSISVLSNESALPIR